MLQRLDPRARTDRQALGQPLAANRRLWAPAACAGLLLALAAAAAPGAAIRSAYSTASNEVVQPQPPAGSCHAIGSGLGSRPDPRCTPGSLNPGVTQATIARTICRAGWTATVRPPERVTEQEKRASMRAYGDSGPTAAYEYDHFVPLELGGAANDPHNLWPEPGASPNAKDRVESELRRSVCAGGMTLARAQHAIESDWVALARAGVPAHGSPRAPQPSRSSPGSKAWCSASAEYSSRYGDYDVYVHSNQPERPVTVSGAGRSASWHTNSSGYADVYLHAGRSDAGAELSVRVGAANCSATL